MPPGGSGLGLACGTPGAGLCVPRSLEGGESLSKPLSIATECSLQEPQDAGGWGHNQQPSQSGGLGWATGVWGRQPGSRSPSVHPATCVLSTHGLSQAHREQGAAAPVSLAPTHTARDMASVLSNAPAFLQCQSPLLHVEVAVNFFQELPFEDLPAGCCRRHATPVYPAEAGRGHCPAVNTTVSPEHCFPGPSGQDITDVQVQPASSMATASPQGGPWLLRLPRSRAGAGPQLAPGQPTSSRKPPAPAS